jgi:hypothetical protein
LPGCKQGDALGTLRSFLVSDRPGRNGRRRGQKPPDRLPKENTMPTHASPGDEVFGLAPDISVQPLGDGEGGVVLHLKSGEIYTINDTTVDFLARVDGRSNLAACAAAIAGIYDVDEATALADLAEIASELVGESILVRIA